MDKHSKEAGIVEYVPITISLGTDRTLDWGEMDADFWSTDIGAPPLNGRWECPGGNAGRRC